MRYIGIDAGAETIKVVELFAEGAELRWGKRYLVEHGKEPGTKLLEILKKIDWNSVTGAAVTGRLSRQINLSTVPLKQAQVNGSRFLAGDEPKTVVSIGSHGFSVLEIRPNAVEVFRENSRCSQGTGNFLRQLVERFDLDIEAAAALTVGVPDPAPLSGRCPVILKTDMTHLANKGENRARILAGLFDAVCENVQVLIKPRISPPEVLLIGGVSRSIRVRETFNKFLKKNGMKLVQTPDDDALFVEALGSAIVASQKLEKLPALGDLILSAKEVTLEKVPGLSGSLASVVRMKAPPSSLGSGDLAPGSLDLFLGFDIGSTGSKVVALEAQSKQSVWEGYLRTNGSPVVAAQELMKQFIASRLGKQKVLALGVTGSGREIVGSLMATCYGAESVYVLNEIAAHAEGALHFDSRVDTIFEIGGQDAKYIRLAHGRVIDAAMNEACSAGTGSFIEEQGKRFKGIESVSQLGQEALCADDGVALGQHCSVFMAEIIDEAFAAGVNQRAIIAGIYDSIIQNYLNRVKGSRSVGQVIFCQGMPFAADALAAAVVRQTGSQVVIPPNPGTVGALGIALLVLKELPVVGRIAIEPARFLEARVESKDVFVCKAVSGCGGSGNKCRIDRISTTVAGEQQKFTWGGGCALHDKGTRKKKLPDMAPDPFRERDDLIAALIERVSKKRGNASIGLTDEFQLKELFPFFSTFLFELGFDVEVQTSHDRKALKRGIEEANIPFCAPMQQFHGIVSMIAETEPDYIFLPMMREAPKLKDEKTSALCPIVQGAPDMLRLDLGDRLKSKMLSPIIDVGDENFASPEFIQSCRSIATELGITHENEWRDAFDLATKAQVEFEHQLLVLGNRALEFCTAQQLIPVVVCGRGYTIYNTVLNSNVPAILREQGAIAIPVDCYPIAADVPVFDDMYWGCAQRILRAAHQVRRTPGQYALFCTNYSCGPDSFNAHFFSYVMEGKPFTVIETDGHSGDAGTKTRLEAFLHCVRGDLKDAAKKSRPKSLKLIELDKESLPDIIRRKERVLIPRMGPGADALAGALRGVGVNAESLPMPTRDTVRVGRRHTSGKECVPMTITLGSLLERIEKDKDTDENFAFLIPNANGPCRFGVYNLLYKVVLERLGWKDRVRMWVPDLEDTFAGIPSGFASLAFISFMATDLLAEALCDVRPVETSPGAALALYDRYSAELVKFLEVTASGDLSLSRALVEIASGKLFGVIALLERAAKDFAKIKADKIIPTVLVVGEMYVRCDPFSNDFVVEKLEKHGIRARLSPINEWLEYMDFMGIREGRKPGVANKLTSMAQRRIQSLTYLAVAKHLKWPKRTNVEASLEASAPYIRDALESETVLTLGGALHEWQHGLIDAVLSVGPHECMPNKIAESQFFHIAEREGLLSLTLSMNGDPLDPEIIANFAYEVHSRFSRRVPGVNFVNPVIRKKETPCQSHCDGRVKPSHDHDDFDDLDLRAPLITGAPVESQSQGLPH